MSFKFSAFVNLAETLANDLEDQQKSDRTVVSSPASQAILRTVISRCYYGAFQEVFIYTRDTEADPETTMSRGRGTGSAKHEYIAEKYKNTKGDKARRLIGQKLDQMRIRRNIMDYDETPTVSMNEAKLILNDAKLVLGKLDEIKGSTPP